MGVVLVLWLVHDVITLYPYQQCVWGGSPYRSGSEAAVKPSTGSCRFGRRAWHALQCAACVCSHASLLGGPSTVHKVLITRV